MLSCTEFKEDVWRKGRCVNCFQFHAAPSPLSSRPNGLHTVVESEQEPSKVTQNCTIFKKNIWKFSLCMNCQRPEALHVQTEETIIEIEPKNAQVSVQITQLEEQLSSLTVKNPDQIIINDEIFLEAETAEELILALSTRNKEQVGAEDVDWDSLEDITDENSSVGSFADINTMQSSHALKLTHLSKFSEETEILDDSGLDLSNFKQFDTAKFSYYSNKEIEISNVKEAAEKAGEQLNLHSNSPLVRALMEILQAKRQQIQKAFDKSKLDKQDYEYLLKQMEEVRKLITNSTHANTLGSTRITTSKIWNPSKLKRKKKTPGHSYGKGSWKVDKFAFSFNFMFREVYNVDSLLRSCVNEAAQLVIHEIKSIIMSTLSIQGYENVAKWIESFSSTTNRATTADDGQPSKLSQLLCSTQELYAILSALDRNLPHFVNDFDLQEVRRKTREWHSLIELLESQEHLLTPLPFLL